MQEGSTFQQKIWAKPQPLLNWQARLATFGSRHVWQNTEIEFHAALARLEALGLYAGLAAPCAALRNAAGLVLEGGPIWLAVP